MVFRCVVYDFWGCYSIDQGNVVRNAEKIEKLDANVNKVSDDIHVPFHENVILNPSGVKANVNRNVGSTGQGSGDRTNVVWPKLNEVNKMDKGKNVVGGSDKDTKMVDSGNANRNLSFINTMQEGSKKWELTLVRTEEGLNYVLENRPWLVEGKPLFVHKWEAGMDMEKLEPGISRIASRVGNPIIMDRITTSMCKKGYGRAIYARVLIEVDASKELVENVEVCYKSLGKSLNLRVEYTWKPPLCTNCRVFGHEFKGCKNRELTEEEKKPYRDGANTSRNSGQQFYGGGFRNREGYYGRGRGGMNVRGGMSGRGTMYQRVNNNENNMRFVLMKSGIQLVDEVQIVKEKSIGKENDKGKKEIREKGGNKQQTSKKNGIYMKNSFSVLTYEVIEEGSEEWSQMKAKIDLACTLGMQIDVNEKRKWSKDLEKYYDDKCKAKNVAMVANKDANSLCPGLMKETGITRNQAYMKLYNESYRKELLKLNEWRVEKQKTEVELFFYSEQVLTKEVRKTWTYEMIAQYECLIGEKVDDMIRDSFDQSVKECMEEDVAEEVTGTARFMTKDEVSNVINEVDTQMQGETNVKDRRVLWKNLRDHFSIAGDFPWVLLGDFNIILDYNDNSNGIGKRNDPSNGVLKKLDRIMGNDKFLDEYPTSFANFLPYNISDHSPAILVIPEVKEFFGTCDVVYPIEEPDTLFTKKLDAEVAVNLIRPISDEEIKITLFDIEDNKASGPDSYSSKFFKAAWKVVGDDTRAAIKEFFRNGKLLVYKTISKIITNRIKMVLNDLIMVCLTTASFSVCINGEPHGFFKAGRRLRQGDPISLYLFTLVMEVLNLMVMRQVKAEKGFKYHWGCKELNITSLCFADDLLMLCHGDLISASVLRRGVLPVRYLGVPMVSKRLTANDCKDDRFGEVTNVLIPKLLHDLEDKSIWVDKKGMEKDFSVKEVWKAVVIKGRLKTLDRISKWMDIQKMEILKPIAKLEGISNDWARIISFIMNKLAANTIWSVIQRLVLSACVYFVWQERNFRWFRKNFIDEECLFKIIVDVVRMKLLGLTIKNTPSVIEAAKIWGLQLHKNDYYKRMVDELIKFADL
ncbi:zinc knuckle CX2CX4HX4C containing protein [Tanacetum coccineum]